MQSIIVFIVVGFVAQMIDGALGMAYGVSANAFLLSLGLPAAAASASVHAAEVVTTGISGAAHLRLGNVKEDLFKRLLIPGVIGGVLGAYILTAAPSQVIKPAVSIYLIIMGLVILWKAIKKAAEREVKTMVEPLAFLGGLSDAIGGGGWGPIVTTTLIARGNHVHVTVGTVNLVEFFVTLAQSITFVLTIGLVHWQIILGLIIGGALAAPLSAYACRKLPTRALMALVGLLIIALSIRTLYLSLA